MIDYCGCSTRLLTLLEDGPLFRKTVILSVGSYIDTAMAISQSVQTQKVVINTLVYLVYGYYNSSTMKEED
jgi:hypothetical protein